MKYTYDVTKFLDSVFNVRYELLLNCSKDSSAWDDKLIKVYVSPNLFSWCIVTSSLSSNKNLKM